MAFLSGIFFASIKSNVNISGLWFFTPLTFSIPFIYAYIFSFVRGIKDNNSQYLVTSLLIMTLLVPIHAISVIFFFPILIFYMLIDKNLIGNRKKILIPFLLLPVFILIFYKFAVNKPWTELWPLLWQQIQFKKGWGVLEIKNSWPELYSLIGYVFALFGSFLILTQKELRDKFLIFVIWAVVVLSNILLYRWFDISLFTPYQRNLYYFVLSLPVLSGVGIFYILNLGYQKLSRFILLVWFRKLMVGVFLLVVVFFIFKDYYRIPEQVALYHLIDDPDYEALKFLKQKDPAILVATPFVSTAAFAISGHKPVATIFFQQKKRRQLLNDFFLETTCEKRKKMVEQMKARYILTQWPIKCGWPLIYMNNKNYVYEVK